jgi:hypothetical protein
MRYFVLTLILIACMSPVMAQSISWNSPVDIAASAFDNNHPRITADRSGNPLVLWGNNMNSKVYFSRWSGSAFTAPLSLAPGNIPVFAESWAGPDIAAFGDTVYVVFKQTPEDTSHIYIVYSYDGGNFFSQPVTVDSIIGFISRFPSVGVDPSGNPLVTFMKFNQGWSNPQYTVVKSADFGNSFMTDVQASGFSGGQVCDCCPAAITASSDYIAVLYRDNLNNIRNMWSGISFDDGSTFPSGLQIDQSNWFNNSCPSSGPDGVIIDDSLYSVFMSEGSGSSLVYYGVSSLLNITSGTGTPITGALPGLNTQNYPRIANSGNAAAIVWVQQANGTDQVMLQYTDNIHNGFYSVDTIANGGQLINADVVLTPGSIHVVWEDANSGTVKYQKGIFITSGIEDESIESDIMYYPNPADNFIHINVKNKDAGIILFNIHGQIVLPLTSPVDGVVNITNVKPGFYTMMIRSENEVYFRKIMIE